MERDNKGDRSEKQEDSYERPGQLINVPPDPPEATHSHIEREYSPKKPDKSPCRWWIKRAIHPISLLTVALVLLAYWQYVVTMGQLDSMNGQLKEMKSNSAQTDRLVIATQSLADAAKKQSDASRTIAENSASQLKATQDLAAAAARQGAAAESSATLTKESVRGRIAITNIRLKEALKVGERAALIVETENIGRATAFVRGASDSARWTGLPTGSMPIKVPAASEGTVVEPGSKQLTMTVDRVPIDEQFLVDTPRPRGYRTTFFFGRIVYETLGEEYFLDFCAYIMPYNTATIPVAPATQGIHTDPRFTPMQCNSWHGEGKLKGKD